MNVLKVQAYSLADLHDAIRLVQGKGSVLVMPDSPLPDWARPLLLELIRQIVAAVSASLKDDHAEET